MLEMKETVNLKGKGVFDEGAVLEHSYPLQKPKDSSNVFLLC